MPSNADGACAALAMLAALWPTATPAREDDGSVWTSVTATAGVAGRLDATMEVHTRFANALDRLGQLLLRPSLTLRLDDRLSLTAGYAYVRSDPPGSGPGAAPTSHEHRAWQQVGYSLVRSDTLTLGGRTRIEQRLVEHRPGTGWRVRQQLRAAVPFRRGGRVQALAWNETFVGLNTTAWGQRGTLDRTRTFAGLSLPLSAGATIEPGYLNQAVFRRGEDAMDHLLAVNVFARF